ncbi:hypothetical protein [Gorillibacterium timonense]|uniref:hypothetical protein n=1 Tax=Gorillibacterium timonense TaxID=1689269 RepID=UPI00131D4500|nr:hypothetical protein [Gorillibacterium timonense]
MYQLSYKGKVFGEVMNEERAMAMAVYLKPCFQNLEVIQAVLAEDIEQDSEQVSA